MKEIAQLILVNIKEFYREPAALFWSFLFPILMSWGLGVAFSEKGESIKNIAVTGDYSGKMGNFLATKAQKKTKQFGIYPRKEYHINNGTLGKITYRFYTVNWDTAMILLKRGLVVMVVTEKNKELKYNFDPVNPDAQVIYMEMRNMLDGVQLSENVSDIKPLTKVGTRYIDFLIPGLMAMGLMSSCLWGLSYDLVDKRSKKLLRRMVATPMKKTNFFLAQIISRLLFTGLEAIALVAFAVLFFNMQIKGSIFALILLFISGNIAFIGLGVLVSSRTDNPQVATGIINAIQMPMMVCSGIFFSYYNFPEWLIPYIQKLPLTMFSDGIRSIFVEGFGLLKLIPTIGILTLFGGLTTFVGLKIYKWH